MALTTSYSFYMVISYHSYVYQQSHSKDFCFVIVYNLNSIRQWAFLWIKVLYSSYYKKAN